MTFLKDFTREKFPSFFKIAKSSYYRINKLLLGKSESQIIFKKIYDNNIWGDPDSVSGTGSNLKNTEQVRKELVTLIPKLNAQSFLDIPCGDFFWMKLVTLPVKKYIGADIVEELIRNNNKNFANDNRHFLVLDIINEPLPQVDIIFCRDCLAHLSFYNIKAAIKQIKKSNSKYLITSTYIEQELNSDLPTGRFRPINLELYPFNFPKPVLLINDKCISGNMMLEDKSLGVWEISELP